MATEPFVTEIYGGEEYSYYPLGEYIVQAPGVCGGRPTFKYTRIEASFILQRLGTDESIDSLVECFEGRITREGILEAIRLAAERMIVDYPGLVAA